MKTTTLKAFLILGGSMLIGTGTMHAGNVDKFGSFVSSALSDFHLQGFYVIAGIVGAGLAFYFLSNHFIKEEKPLRHRINYTNPRRHHHRSIVKKTQ